MYSSNRVLRNVDSKLPDCTRHKTMDVAVINSQLAQFHLLPSRCWCGRQRRPGHDSEVMKCGVCDLYGSGGLHRRVANHTCCLGDALQWYLCTHAHTHTHTFRTNTQPLAGAWNSTGRLPVGRCSQQKVRLAPRSACRPRVLTTVRRWASRRDHPQHAHEIWCCFCDPQQ